MPKKAEASSPPPPGKTTRARTRRRTVPGLPTRVRDLTHPLALQSNFGMPPSARNVAMMYNDASTGAVTTKHELGLVVNDYFDYNAIQPGAGNIPQFVTHYWWDNAQNLFNTDPSAPAGIDSTFCRVRKVEVWVLPQARGLDVPPVGIIQSTTNADQMYTVSCQVPGTTFQPQGTALNARAFAANTQVTNVLPQFDTKWKKVMTCDLQKTFQSAVMSPVFRLSFHWDRQRIGPTNVCFLCRFLIQLTGRLISVAMRTTLIQESAFVSNSLLINLLLLAIALSWLRLGTRTFQSHFLARMVPIFRVQRGSMSRLI
jgi:hypothetical protein